MWVDGVEGAERRCELWKQEQRGHLKLKERERERERERGRRSRERCRQDVVIPVILALIFPTARRLVSVFQVPRCSGRGM